MKSLLRILSLGLMLGLWACVTHKPGEELEQCQINCKERFEFCKAECINSCPNCTSATDEITACRYEQYVHEQEVQGGIIGRELHSYRDPLQCRKVTCNCSADFSVCSQACIGEIQKQLRAKPFCI